MLSLALTSYSMGDRVDVAYRIYILSMGATFALTIVGILVMSQVLLAIALGVVLSAGFVVLILMIIDTFRD